MVGKWDKCPDWGKKKSRSMKKPSIFRNSPTMARISFTEGSSEELSSKDGFPD